MSNALGWASFGLDALAFPLALYQDYSQQKKMAKQHQYNIDMLRRTTQAQKDLFDYQFDANNQYNNPTAQVERLKAAGLNLNLMYGNGASTGNASSSMPGVNATSNVGLPNTPDYAGAMHNTAQSLISAKQLDLQEKSVSNDSKRTTAESLLKNNQAMHEIVSLRNESMTALANKDLSEAQRDYYQRQIKILDYQEQQIIKQNNLLEAQAKKEAQQTALLEVETSIREVEKKFAPEVQRTLIKVNKSIASKNYAEAKSALAQAHFTDKQRELLEKSFQSLVTKAANEAIGAGLINKETAAKALEHYEYYIKQLKENQITIATFEAKLASEWAQLGFNMGPSQAFEALKSIGIAVAGAGVGKGISKNTYTAPSW